MGRTRPLSWAALAAVTGLIAWLWPHDAYAWGPLAHLEFASSSLGELSSVSPALRLILGQFASDYLYGSVAADIVVGKNLARYAVHCHNWAVGFRVMDRARTDAQRAFSLGFLAHLAADTIAHNYYVPYKTVQGFGARACGHAYWELRYDQTLPRQLWRMARHVFQARYRRHDGHLAEALAESSVIPFALSRRVFGSLLLATRLKKWQQVSQVIAGERRLALHLEEVRECAKLAVGQIVDVLRHGPDARCTRADPTGGRNLHMALQLRGSLRRSPRVSSRARDEVVRLARPAFREAIYGRLTLPEIPEAA